MDNLCHTLVGAAMGRAGLERRTRFGTAALMVAANVPDLDVLVFLTDTSNLSFRRGWTHGIVSQLVLPVAVTGFFWLLHRLRPARSVTDGPPRFHAGWLLLLAYLGVYSHVFLDLLNTYGVRLLSPLDWRWRYGDAVFIVDIWLWLALGLGVWLARRRKSTRPARTGLVVAACYIAAMIVSARVAREIVVDAWRDAQGTEPRALMVGPVPLTPFRREVIVDAGDRYQVGYFDWRTRTVEWEPMAMPKNDRLPEVAAARGHPDMQPFLVWSRFPWWDVQETSQGARVTVRDMRFMTGGRQFSASTIVTTKDTKPE
jgi:inner membrane protein